MSSKFDRYTPWILVAGDLVALLAFVYSGQQSHEIADSTSALRPLLVTGSEFVVPWFVAGALLGAFPRGEALTVRRLMARSLNAWLVAAPLGVLMRALLLGRAVIPTVFLIIAMGLGGAFVLGWRLVFALIRQAALRHRSARPGQEETAA